MNIRLLLVGIVLTGCTQNISFFPKGQRSVLSPIHNCAIGYDLAQQIYANVSLRSVVLVTKAKPNTCLFYTNKYLRLAGFAIDNSTRGQNFNVVVKKGADDQYVAVGSIGNTISISRAFTLAKTGVYAASAVSVMHIDENQAEWRPVEGGQYRRNHFTNSNSNFSDTPDRGRR